jgi:hypothetical protein
MPQTETYAFDAALLLLQCQKELQDVLGFAEGVRGSFYALYDMKEALLEVEESELLHTYEYTVERNGNHRISKDGYLKLTRMLLARFTCPSNFFPRYQSLFIIVNSRTLRLFSQNSGSKSKQFYNCPSTLRSRPTGFFIFLSFTFDTDPKPDRKRSEA